MGDLGIGGGGVVPSKTMRPDAVAPRPTTIVTFSTVEGASETRAVPNRRVSQA
jgi:hypothetical protein